MNAHDSERIKGMLEELGLGEAPTAGEADVVVFNTCTIREKPDTKLAAYLGEAAARKREHPDRVIAVGGCYAEAQRERIFELYPAVDVAFGPGSIAHLGEWLGPRRGGGAPRPLGVRQGGGGGAPAARVSPAAASVSTSESSRRSCRRTTSAPSRRGCRCRWAATRSARTASSRRFAAGSKAGARARSCRRWSGSPGAE